MTALERALRLVRKAYNLTISVSTFGHGVIENMIVKGGASAYPGGGTRAAQCGASVSIMEFARNDV